MKVKGVVMLGLVPSAALASSAQAPLPLLLSRFHAERMTRSGPGTA